LAAIESLAGFLQLSNSLVEQTHFTEGDAEIVVVSGSSSANATSVSRSVFSSPNMSAKSTPAFCQKKTWRCQLQQPAVVQGVLESGP
jgi:CHASE1-domain containing sensor protein